MDLSTRELAILIWFGIILLWTATHRSVRASFLRVLEASANKTIVVFVALLGVYTLAEVYLLHAVGLWRMELLKTTLGWFALTGLTSGVNALTSYDDPPYWKYVRESLRIAVLLELIFGKFTFSLPVELFLVPFVTVVMLLATVNDMRNKDPQVKAFLGGIQVIIGLTVLTAAALRAIREYSILADPLVLMDFLLPPILSLLFIPALYLIVLYARYEWLFLKLQGDSAFRRHAKFRLIRHLGFQPKTVLAFGRKHAFVLPGMRTKAELQQLLTDKPVDE